MKKDDSIFLKHMLDAINLIEEYLRDKDYDEFKNNRMLQDAVIREIEIIGEATKNLSMAFRNKHPNIPWRQIAGMRDKLIHGYFGVDVDAVWDTVMKDIPSLKEKLQKIIKEGKK
ncbi:MAG: DUF86 domain-containing protein [Candidatus Methanospirare jalkutatii]|nr:DUF86 domain-containing protein [Candidatus Methanospirare jalkutatii]